MVINHAVDLTLSSFLSVALASFTSVMGAVVRRMMVKLLIVKTKSFEVGRALV